MYMYIQKGNGILFIVVVCMNSCLPTNCDNVVSCIQTLSPVPSTVCVSAPYSELHKPELLWCNGLKCGGVIVYKLWCVVVKKNCGDVFM